MNLNTYQKLEELHRKFGAQEFGKLCQKFLALTFQRIGYNRVTERGVQGVDVDAAGAGDKKYTIEVKTTKQDSINFEMKDAEGLKKRSMDGYLPLLAVLRLSPLSEWYLSDVTELQVGRVSVEALRPYRFKELERRIEPVFDRSVEEHFAGTMQRGQGYLDEILRRDGVELGLP
jgi:Holliday junction resolvase